jgi:hypothetical protein
VEEQYRARNTDHATSLCRTVAGAAELPWANGRITCALGWIERNDKKSNEKAAEAAAVAEFDLSDEQRRRLVVQQRS